MKEYFHSVIFWLGRVTCKIAENPAIAEKVRVTKLSAIAEFYCISKPFDKNISKKERILQLSEVNKDYQILKSFSTW